MIESLKVPIAAGAKVNQGGKGGNKAFSTFTDASLGTAALRGDLSYIKQSIALGADVNALYDMSTASISPVIDDECANKKYATPLMIAAVRHIEY